MLSLTQNKIIFLFTPGPIGGAEKVVIGGIKALQQSSLKVELWIIKEERAPHVAEAFMELATQEGLSFRTFSSRSIFDIQLLLELKKAFSEAAPHIVHAHGFKAAFYGKLSAPGTFVITHHGKTGHTLKVRIYEFLELMMMKRSSAVIAVSNEMKSMLIGSGVDAGKVHLVENFLTLQPVPRIASGLSRINLLFVGRLSPEKGCAVLIEAIGKLNDPDIFLTVLGDGVERKNLEKSASDRIQFLGFTKDITPHLANADALVMPSFREGQPLTLIEACIMGLPVIASNVGGIPELVRNNQNGFLFDAGNSHDLSDKIKMFKLKKDELNQNAEEMKSSFLNRFDPKTWSKNTQSVYQTVLSQR